MTWQPSQLTPAQLQERRLEAGRLLLSGQLSQAQIARQLGVSRTAVHQWHQQLQQASGHLSSLHNRQRSGRPAALTLSQWQAVLQQMRQGAPAAGYADARWTLERVQRLIRHNYGVRYHIGYLSRRLRALGWSVQKPAVVARERDQELVQAWLRQDWPRIKKGAAARCDDSVCG